MIDLIAALAVTVVVHELGHAAAASMLRLPWKPVLTRRGPGMKIGSDAITLTHFQVATTSAGGPAANVLLGIVALAAGLPTLALLSFLFALLNLLPFLPHSDGRRIILGQEIGDTP